MTWAVRAIRSNEKSPAYVPSPSPRARCTIEMKFGSHKAGDGQATATAQTAQGASPKTALWPRQPRAPHGKARSATRASRKSAVWLVRGSQNAPFREDPCPECAFPSRRGAREVWGNPPARLRGTMENASTGQMRSSNPPPGCGVGCAGVRKSRLGVWSHGKAHSEALWPSHLTKNRTLQPVPHQKPQFGWSEARRTRLSVRTRAQSALFRDVPCPECAFP